MSRRILYSVVLAVVFQFGGCSFTESNNSNDLSNVSIPNPVLPGFPKDNNVFGVDENFKKKWQDEYNSTFTEIEKNRRLWQENKIENYDFEVGYLGGAVSGWHSEKIKVRESKNISVVEILKDSVVDKSQLKKLETIEKIFDFMKDELDGGRLVKAEFNKKSGFPEKINIIYSNAIDANGYYYIDEFVIIE